MSPHNPQSNNNHGTSGQAPGSPSSSLGGRCSRAFSERFCGNAASVALQSPLHTCPAHSCTLLEHTYTRGGRTAPLAAALLPAVMSADAEARASQGACGAGQRRPVSSLAAIISAGAALTHTCQSSSPRRGGEAAAAAAVATRERDAEARASLAGQRPARGSACCRHVRGRDIDAHAGDRD